MHVKQQLLYVAPFVFAVAFNACSARNDGKIANSPTHREGSAIHMTDVTQSSGVRAIYRNGREANEYSILESLGGGVAMFDYDRDGKLDLFFPQGGKLGPSRQIAGHPSVLWRNVDGLRFVEVGQLAGVDSADVYTHGCSAADYDNDGFPDLLVTGYGGLHLFRNQGDGTMVELGREVGLHDELWSSSAAWGDLNGDSNLDLYVAHYVNWSWDNNPACVGGDPPVQDVCPPKMFEGLTDIVYYSDGDGSFRDATSEAGIVPEGKGLGVLIVDVDNDIDLDVYVANDTTPNFMYMNDGSGKFSEVGLISGTAVDDRGIANGSMGVAALDHDSNGLLDLWVANFEKETFALYRNEGTANFTHVSESAGISALGQLYVGFGTVAGDFDRDGDDDLAVANGHVMYYGSGSSGPQAALLLTKDSKGNFQRVEFSPESYFSQLRWGRGLAAGDLDNDGDLDFVFTNTNEPAAILSNEIAPTGDWLSLRLVGIASSRDAIGARAVLHTSSGDYLKVVYGGGSYLSQSDYRLFWGIRPDAEVQSITIHWPSGVVQEIRSPPAGKYLDILEAGAAVGTTTQSHAAQ